MGIVSSALNRLCQSRPARVIESGGEPYMYRIFLFRVWGWNCYLHHFVSADAERWIHDHPFNGLAVVLTGGYVEEELESLSWPNLKLRMNRVRFLNWISGHKFHRIVERRANTWTLFVHGPKFKGWGFLEAAGNSITYDNPFGNVRDAKWWIGAPTYKALLNYEHERSEQRLKADFEPSYAISYEDPTSFSRIQ